jgi:hypothetical protein
MKYRKLLPAVLVLALRLFRESPRQWAGDWIAVLALLWIAIVLTREDSRSRRLAVALSCAWLAGIYAIHQGPWTFRFGG